METQGPTTLGDYSPVISALYLSVTERLRVPPLSGPLSREQLDERRKSFVETVAYHSLVERLVECRVQVLRGEDGSGRTTTALLALDDVIYPAGQEAHRPDPESNVAVLDCEPDTITEKNLEEGHGYLLDRSSATLEGQLNLGLLGQLKKLANDGGAFLILIVSDRTPLDPYNLRDYLVHQDRPDPAKVLQAHLRYREAHWTDELRKEVEWELRANPAPGPVAELAKFLNDAENQGLSPDEILVRFGERLMARARGKLAKPFGDAVNGDRRSRAESLCRQAQLITCAVLSGMPLVIVMEAAASLAARLYRAQIGQSDERSLPRPVFGDTVDDVHKYAEATDCPPDETSDPNDVTRRRWMRPSLATRVLEIAWLEYDTVREPLLAWLEDLVQDKEKDEALRVRAAIAVGKLASYDFEYIFSKIDQWASSQSVAPRWAAAWALEMAARDPLLAPRVRGRIEQWCRGPRRYQQRTALLAFTTSIGPQDVEGTLEDLRLLATHSGHARDYALALAVREIFLAGYDEKARELLDKWAGADVKKPLERPLAVQAARSLLTLSEGTDEVNGDTTPDLVSLFADDPKWRDTATRVWPLALTEPATSEAGWNVLRLWLRRGGQEPRLIEPLIGLVADLACDPGLRNRLRFRQLFWNTNKTTRHPVVNEILTRALSASSGSPTPTAPRGAGHDSR
ncbi:MAG: hypothetical protein ACRD0K_03290 [Egibacteraceae bacterium]